VKVIFLGTNGWFDTDTGNTTCVLVETGSEYIVLDAGFGLNKLDRYIHDAKPIYLFLSHFHLDHIIGLHTLAKFQFNQGIHIYGQKGTEDILNRIVNNPFTLPFSKLPYPIEVFDLPNDEMKLPFNVETAILDHSSPTLGFRFSIGEKVITYCTDTGYCANAIRLSKDADLLIAECSYKIGEENEHWPHLNPGSASRLAITAAAKKLAMMHFDPSRYNCLEERNKAEIHAKGCFINSFVAMDDMKIEV